MKSPNSYFDLNHEVSFKHERPIESFDEDVLSNDNFSKNLAINIQNYFENNDQCLTVGLMGDWGSGKTSILNLTKIHLKETDIEVMEFNPWIYSSYNQLIEQFFDELIALFSQETGLVKHLTEYRIKLNKSNIIKSILPTLASIKSSELGEILNKTFNIDSDEKSLFKIKENINEELESHKVLCIIDDLDRLNSSEINDMFKLIKIMANFNNIVYLIAFDKDIISSALEDNYAENFIEKIINVPLEVPLTSKIEIKNILEDYLSDLSEKHDILLDWDTLNVRLESENNYRTEGYGILRYFNTIRDIKRFINILEFNTELVKNEVNFEDFIAITAIQLFNPDLYEKIKSNESLLVMCTFSKINYNEDILKKEQHEFEKIVGSDENSKYLLQVLFPKMHFIYGLIDVLDILSYDGQLLICHKNHFKTYFKLNPILKEINEYEISITIDLINSKNEVELFNQFGNLEDMGKLDLFLKNLKNRVDQVTENEFLLTVIFSFYRKYDVDNFDKGHTVKMKNLLYDLSLNVISGFESENRFDILKQQFLDSNYMELLILFVFHFKNDFDWDFEKSTRVLFSGTEVADLENILKNKFDAMLDLYCEYVESNIVEMLDVGMLLGFSSEVNEFFENYISTNKNLLTFLKLFISEAENFSEHEIQELSDFIDLNPIKDKIDENYDELKDEIVVKKFLKGYELWLDDVID